MVDVQHTDLTGTNVHPSNPVHDYSVWDDLRVALTTTKLGGVKDPGFAQLASDGAGSTGVYAYHFDKTTEEEVFCAVQMPHSWEEGSDIEPHVHWLPTDTDTGAVVWGLEYAWLDFDGTLGNTTILTVTDAADGTDGKHQLASFGTISGAGHTVSSMLMCRVFRKAADAADTYNADAAALEFDIHYQRDAAGSDNQYTK